MAIEQYLEELRDPSRPLLASRLSELSALLPDEVPLLEQQWPQIHLTRRRQILRRLLDLAEDNVELNFDALFVTALSDEDPEARALAIQGLWEHEGRDIISPLIEMLRNDRSETVRAQAAIALGSFVLRSELQRLHAMDARRVEEALRAAIDDQHESQEVQARALESVGPLSNSWIRGTIEKAYHGPNHRLRVSAVHAMGLNCDPHWFPDVQQELASDDPEMRFEAATACASCCDESAVPLLKPLLEDEDAEVQEAAIMALGEIGGGEATRALAEIHDHPEPRVREAVAAALEEMEFNEDPLGFHVR
jgi:HEAT repeat protein